MRNLPTNLAQGQAGAYTVAAQLLLRGINPCFPSVDIGADIVTDGGIKVQVKSGRLLRKGSKFYKGDGAYWFKLNTRAIVRNRKIIKTIPRIFSEECDFVVLWGIDSNRFWVVPSPVLDGHMLCVVGPESAFAEADINAIQADREAGIPYRTIAERRSLTLSTVFRIANMQNMKASLVSRVREYEDRWDLIVSYPGNARFLCGSAVPEVELPTAERIMEKRP